MSVELFTKNLKEARRDALVNHYLASHDFGRYQDKVTNPDALYEYLLLDTKISNNVTTSPLSEAVSSLQLYIHRALEGYDGELASGANAYLAQDAFLANWDSYNKRYASWAGKEKLRFYAGNYIDPTLRTNKTALFDELENSLNQGKLTDTQVKKALAGYISGYDRFADINYLCAGAGNADDTVLYLTGELNGQYYWREVRRNAAGKPVYWGEWRPLPTEIKDPEDNLVMMSLKQGKRVCRWVGSEKRQEGDKTFNVKLIYCWQLNNNGNWEKRELLDVTFTPSTGYESKFSHNELKQISDYHLSFTSTSKHDKTKITGAISFDPEHNSVTFRVKENNRENLYYWNVFDTDGNSKIAQKHPGHYTVLIKRNKENWSCKFSTFYNFEPYETDFEIYVTNAIGPLPIWGSIKDGWLYNAKGEKQFTVNAPASAKNLSALLDNGLAGLLNYNKQATIAGENWFWGGVTDNDHKGNAFSGPYGLYLWELFFHLPLLIAVRFATEQRFEQAERWYKYLFNSAGYRDADGKLLTDKDKQTDKDTPRYWNCYPLQQDGSWDAFKDMAASNDPDVIAMADPMHYKLAVFLHTIELLLARGDAAYRMLERDTLTEAKMFYIQAQQLLGPRPDIRITNSWHNPTLATEAGAINTPRNATVAPHSFSQWLRAGDSHEMGDGDFLPPYNDALLGYWDKLALRLYNLRHNLSLDGQPLDLPLFATPTDPAELHRQQSGGDGVQGDASPAGKADGGWRYPLLAERARGAVSQLSQFGASLLGALERRDSEQMTLLLQNQQVTVLGRQQEIAQKNLDGLNAGLGALTHSRDGAQLRKTHYNNLINGGYSAAEQNGLRRRNDAMVVNTASIGMATAGGILSTMPNTFGMANGGGDWGAALQGAAQAMQTTAMMLDQSATISEITAGYQRRSEEWRLQRDIAANEVNQNQAQIDNLKAQIAMQQKQIALTESEAANAQAVYELQSSRFSGQALYNWMVGRLSALYYQLYDATVPACLQARNALTRELGKEKADGLFHGAVWNDLWQGLLAAEGLTTELQKLDNVWLQHAAQGLEATRTVSLAALRNEAGGNLSAVIGEVLAGKTDAATNGKLKLDTDNAIFSAELDLAPLGLAGSYNDTQRKRFIKRIAVTLPTLLGPYQDIKATLSGGGQTATLSHGRQDSGRFVISYDDSRFLPFEGLDATSGKLSLNIFHVRKAGAKETPNQRALVEQLSDIIFHIDYIMR